ncbi:hypothetical protein [Rhodococcus qingshengii]|uniref:hypothetical protein n=1 Tax=Rhodococcus qingshengii TaxID=334542 RepID=UPI0020350232|nr:hypothetical protein [Rhodococcus qingshengii]
MKSLSEVLEEVTEGAVALLEGVDHAGVTLAWRIGPSRWLDNLESVALAGQSRIRRGYGSDSAALRCVAVSARAGSVFRCDLVPHSVRIDDVVSVSQWPQLMVAVVEQTPVRSSLWIQLFVDGQRLGALNLFSGIVGGIYEEVEEQAINLATHAAIALSSARRGEQFSSALA